MLRSSGLGWFPIAAGLALLPCVGARAQGVDTSPSCTQPVRDPAGAEALFRSGRELLEQRAFESALAKFEESHRLDPTAGALFNLGECHAGLGRVASAWASYREASALAEIQGKPDLDEVAAQRAQALESRLSYLTLEVAHPVQGMQIRRDGLPVGAAQVGVALPIDPGPHRIAVRAPGYQSVELAVAISREGETKTLRIPKLSRLVPVVATKGVVTPEPGAASTAWPWALGGVGAGVLVIGAAAAIVAWHQDGVAEDACPERVDCGSRAVLAQGRRDLAKNLAWVAVPVGVVALSGAAAWIWLSPATTDKHAGQLNLVVQGRL